MRAIKGISFRRRLRFSGHDGYGHGNRGGYRLPPGLPSGQRTHNPASQPHRATREVLVATLWITRHASELVAVSSTATNVGMTAESLRENAIAVRTQQAGLQRQLAEPRRKGLR